MTNFGTRMVQQKRAFVVVLTSAMFFGGLLARAQQAERPPLPPGYVYQIISKTNAGDWPFVTADELKLPPPPPGFVIAVVPAPTSSVETAIELFEGLSDLSSTTASSLKPGVKRQRSARLNGAWNASRSGKFVLNLFENAVYTAVVERIELVGPSLVRICHLEEKPQSRLIIAERNGIVAASLQLPGENWYSIRYEGNGCHKISELQPRPEQSLEPQCVVHLQEGANVNDSPPQP